MGLGWEREADRLAPGPVDPVGGLVSAVGHVGVEQVGEGQLETGELLLEHLGPLFVAGHALAQGGHRRPRRLRFLAPPLLEQGTDRLGAGVALGLHLLDRHHHLAPVGVDRQQAVEVGVRAAPGEAGPDHIGVAAVEL